MLLIILPCFTPLLPIHLSYTFEGTGKVYPIQEWILNRDQEGGIISTVYNHHLGVISEVSSYKFERGDIANVRISPFQDQSVRFISRGDTIATVRSYLLEERLNTLRLQLEVEKARLRSEQAGAKGPIIAEATQRLAYAKEQLTLAQLNYDRTKKLYDDGVVPEASFNKVENEYKLAQIQIKIATSSLDAAKMGQKPELLSFILATMESLEQELAFLQTKRSGYHIVSPISGSVDYTINVEQIMTVDDTSKMVLTVPVQLSHQAYLKIGTTIEIKVPGIEQIIEGKVSGINDEVQVLDNKQVILVKASFQNPPQHVRKGVMVKCTFVCDTIELWDYIDRSVKTWSH
ncbi:MAG: HlyD family secretion protein [Bacteroidia bacterium]